MADKPQNSVMSPQEWEEYNRRVQVLESLMNELDSSMLAKKAKKTSRTRRPSKSRQDDVLNALRSYTPASPASAQPARAATTKPVAEYHPAMTDLPSIGPTTPTSII